MSNNIVSQVELELKMAEEELRRLRGDEEERERYERREEYLLEKISALDWAREKGIEKVRLEVTKNLIQKGLDDEFIAEITEVSVSDIENVRKQLNIK